MPRPKSLKGTIAPIVHEFAEKLAAFIERGSNDRARDAVLAALGDARWPALAEQRGAARAPNGAGKLKKRKKPPLQLCPVPGCRNAAAPVYGMVCGDHRRVPKAKIRKYREARRKAKERAAG